MITIKICDVAPRGACSYYRSIGPLSKLSKINPEIKVEYVDAISWMVLSDADILFLARPVEQNYIDAIELAQSFGLKVWIDFDDALGILPTDNPGHKYFTQDYIQKNISLAIHRADIVTVSTESIKSIYAEINPNIHVVENAFNDYNYPFVKRENKSSYISWRGSNTHRNDLLSVENDIARISFDFEHWHFVFIGGDPWYICPKKNGTMIEDLEIVKYNRFLYNLQPDIHICPLLVSDFNACKSNISWIESTWAGAACLAPPLPEFSKPGVINYTDNFGYLLEKLIKSREFRQTHYLQSFEYIHDNLLLSKINQKRIEIIEEVFK